MAQILLAEDDDSMREFLAKALTRAGHDVRAVGDGLDALTTLSEEQVDLLLADVVMPGLDGIELARRAAKEQPHIKVMFITGFAAVAPVRRLDLGDLNFRFHRSSSNLIQPRVYGKSSRLSPDFLGVATIDNVR